MRYLPQSRTLASLIRRRLRNDRNAAWKLDTFIRKVALFDMALRWQIEGQATDLVRSAAEDEYLGRVITALEDLADKAGLPSAYNPWTEEDGV